MFKYIPDLDKPEKNQKGLQDLREEKFINKIHLQPTAYSHQPSVVSQQLKAFSPDS